MYTQYVAKGAHDVQLSLEYAQECYLSDTSNDLLSLSSKTSSNNMSSLCRSFKKPNLNWETRTGLCPFHSQMCHERSRTLVFDTGYIDSHDDLGINANPKDRLRYRRNTTCAVLNGDGRINGWGGQIVNSSSPRPAPQEAHAYYGPSLYKGTNWTYSYSNFASFYDNFTAQVTLPYQLDVEQAMAVTSPQYTESDFEPIPELVQEKADLALLFLSFTGMYLGPVDDPWYSAHHQQAFDTGLPFLNDRCSEQLYNGQPDKLPRHHNTCSIWNPPSLRKTFGSAGTS
ncbi:hypothetical protein LTR98_005422 [Exophiala xenobiotica]|nr:hypothetical protein LTR14_007744 [Exophiala xenobiotica]KAK5339022.1 hypothetical protein LTR98_005422 [Exophiala xenobiotica]KAK5422361.1 hypothetical protein LTR06_000618 [Exophiala xenobiotica]KAK5447384.1 hypothetical protein LTR18_002963 [Exophiala xenobiotica]KAK5543241.1 hypothetical protein LTR23_005004 [Chaetothyriales sp. CCFEE 6169]